MSVGILRPPGITQSLLVLHEGQMDISAVVGVQFSAFQSKRPTTGRKHVPRTRYTLRRRWESDASEWPRHLVPTCNHRPLCFLCAYFEASQPEKLSLRSSRPTCTWVSPPTVRNYVTTSANDKQVSWSPSQAGSVSPRSPY